MNTKIINPQGPSFLKILQHNHYNRLPLTKMTNNNALNVPKAMHINLGF